MSKPIAAVGRQLLLATLLQPLVWLGAAFSFTGANAALAADDVHVPNPELNRQVYVANALSRNDFKADMLAGVMATLVKQYPNLLASDLQRYTLEAKQQLEAHLPESATYLSQDDADIQQAFLNVITGVSADYAGRYSPVATAVKEFGSAYLRIAARTIDPNRFVDAQRFTYDHFAGLQRFRGDNWAALHALALQKPEVGQAVDYVFAVDLLASVHDGAEAIFDHNLPLATFMAVEDLRRLIGADGLTADVDQLKETTSILFEYVRSSGAAHRELLGALVAGQTSLEAYLRDEEKRRRDQAQIERLDQLKVGAAKASVYLLSTFLSTVNPKLGNEVQMVGSGGIQIASAISQFTRDFPKNGTRDAVGYGAVILTSNVVGGAMQLFSVFSDTGPSPDQLILEELRALREQIATLRMEIHARFDRVDSALNLIYERLSERFDRVEWDLGRLRGTVAETQRALLMVAEDVSRVERNVYAFLDATSRERLGEAVNGSLGFQQRTGLTMPYSPDFITGENLFHTWASLTAKNAIHAGPDHRDLRPEALNSELRFPPAFNVNYLLSFFSQMLGRVDVATSRQPNPRDFATGVNAYVQLFTEWPEHAARISSTRLDRLLEIGRELRGALRDLGSDASLTIAVDYYLSRLGALRDAVLSKLSDFERDPANHLGGLSLWSALDTPVADFDPEITQIRRCDGSGFDHAVSALPLDSGSLFSDVPHSIRMAAALGLGQASVCLADARYVVVNPSAFCKVFELKLTVRIRWNDHTIQVREALGPPRTGLPSHPRDCPSIVAPDPWRVPPGSSQNIITRHWASVIAPNLLQNSRLVSDLPDAHSAVAEAVRNRLQDLQELFLHGVLDDLDRSSDLHAAAAQVEGAKLLVQAVFNLTAERALDRVDYLRALVLGPGSLADVSTVRDVYAATEVPVFGSNPWREVPSDLVRGPNELRRLVTEGLVRSTGDSIPVLDFALKSLERLRDERPSVDTPMGANVAVRANNVTVTFSSVDAGGVTTINPISTAEVDDLPRRFSVFNHVAFEVTTTAAYRGTVLVCATVPADVDSYTFKYLRVFHNDGTGLRDETVLPPESPAPDYATRTLCARTTQLSPFTVARFANQPPIAVCLPSVTLAANESCLGVAYPADLDGGSNDPDGDPLHRAVRSDGLPLGRHRVLLTVADPYGEVSTCEAWDVVVTDQSPPLVMPPSPVVQDNDPGHCSARVAVGRAEARDNCTVDIQLTGSRTDGRSLDDEYPAGATTSVVWMATDANGNVGVASQSVRVADTEAPVLRDLTADPTMIWPPNHTMRDVILSYDSTDNCDPRATTRCDVAVASNEPYNGVGDGHTPIDFEILDSRRVRLRAERSGAGTGRLYTLTVACRDAVQNVAADSTQVTVPKRPGR